MPASARNAWRRHVTQRFPMSASWHPTFLRSSGMQVGPPPVGCFFSVTEKGTPCVTSSWCTRPHTHTRNIIHDIYISILHIYRYTWIYSLLCVSKWGSLKVKWIALKLDAFMQPVCDCSQAWRWWFLRVGCISTLRKRRRWGFGNRLVSFVQLECSHVQTFK